MLLHKKYSTFSMTMILNFIHQVLEIQNTFSIGQTAKQRESFQKNWSKYLTKNTETQTKKIKNTKKSTKNMKMWAKYILKNPIMKSFYTYLLFLFSFTAKNVQIFSNSSNSKQSKRFWPITLKFNASSTQIGSNFLSLTLYYSFQRKMIFI